MPRRTDNATFVADALAAGIDAIEDGGRPEPVVADLVARRLRASHHAIASVSPDGASVEFETAPATFDRELLMDAAAALLPRGEPLLDDWLSGRTRPVATMSQLVARAPAWRDSRAYWVMEHALGCTEVAGVRLARRNGRRWILGIARDGSFTRRELDLLDSLARPLRALQGHADSVESTRRRDVAGAVPGPGDVAATPDTAVDHAAYADAAGLTLRELEVLHLLSQGLLASTIASRLRISPRTVHRHLAAVYTKLGTHDRLTTVIRSQELGILDSLE